MTLKEIDCMKQTTIRITTTYQLGDHYKVTHYEEGDEYGLKTKNILVKPTEEEYPWIYYRKPFSIDKTQQAAPFFVIADIPRGREISAKEAKELSRGYEEAVRAVKALTEAFCI